MNSKEWQEWKALPHSKQFFAYLKERRENGKEDLATGLFSQMDNFPVRQAHALGGLEMIKEIIELEEGDIVDE